MEDASLVYEGESEVIVDSISFHPCESGNSSFNYIASSQKVNQSLSLIHVFLRASSDDSHSPRAYVNYVRQFETCILKL